GGSRGTATNGTYVPPYVPVDSEFWYVRGQYLAEGHIGTDGRRRRLTWSFHLENEADLVTAVQEFWRGLGVKCDARRGTTVTNVTVSSVLLAALFEHVLQVGSNCYTKTVPDAIWSCGEGSKWMLLRGLWDGDGSWSLVNGGPSTILEYGTVSPRLA